MALARPLTECSGIGAPEAVSRILDSMNGLTRHRRTTTHPAMSTSSNRIRMQLLWIELLCLAALLQHPCWSAPSDLPTPSALPCSDSSTEVAHDTHVFFPDENLERLALRLSSSLYADKQIYARLVRDVTMIRDGNPKLSAITYIPHSEVRVLNVYLTPTDFERARKSLYLSWNCLNRFLGATIVIHPEFDYAELTFAGLYNPDIVSAAYRALPGVTQTEFGATLGDGSNIYVTREATVWHYLFDIAGGDCMAGCTEHDMHYFAITPDGRAPKAAVWNSKSHAPPPAWATAYFREYH